ncbi:MAG: hypothetical protein HY319_01345 [Armatimonadetes bacterium]|nr:hypothetical protein [Armatimonadota bacterium]
MQQKDVVEVDRSRGEATPRVALLTAALGGWCLWAGEAPEPFGPILPLALGALALELTSVRLPGFGFFSTGFAAYGAAALLLGVRPAALLALAGIGVRTLLQGGPSAGTRAREFLADALPILAALGAAAALPEPYGSRAAVMAALYVPLAGYVPAILASDQPGPETAAWRKTHGALWGLQVGVACLPPLAAAAHGWAGLWLVGVALALSAAGRMAVAWSRSDQKILSAARTAAAEEQVGQLREALTKTRTELQIKLEERLLLEELTRSFAQSPSLESTLDLAIGMIDRLLPADTVVFFLQREGRLVPVRYRSPQAERLAGLDLLAVVEPVITAGWTTGRLTLTRPEHLRSPRVFEGERQAVAIPLQKYGVLYVGKQDASPYTREQLYLLALLADQTLPALVAALRWQELQETVRLHAAANSHLRVWNERLTALLDAARSLSSKLSVGPLLEALPGLIASMVPAQEAGCIVLGEQVRSWPPEAVAQVEAVARAVAENRRPLLLAEVAQTAFPPAFPGHRSLLAAPLLEEQGCLGVVLVSAAAPDAFSRDHQDLLHTFCFYAASVLKSARLYEQVVETNRLLAESQDQLIQSSKMAAVGQLAAGVAHELNSPLGAVLLQVQSARRSLARNQTDRTLPKLDVAEEAVRRARDIISKLLLYSRKAPETMEPLDLREVVRDALELLGRQIEKQGVTIRARLEEVPLAMGNATELQQVVTNLLLNAADAVAEAVSPEVLVATRGTDATATLSVQDHGTGISPDVRERIFEPFFTTKPVGRGVGLGLSVTRQLVERHGGTISVQSVPGEGTTFLVCLPAASVGSTSLG